MRQMSLALLLAACFASLLGNGDARARSLFQSVTNSSNLTSSNLTTIFYSSTPAPFSTATSVDITAAVETTEMGTSTAGTTSLLGGLTTNVSFTTPSFTTAINMSAPIPPIVIPIGNATIPGVPGTVSVLEFISFPVPDPAQDYVMAFGEGSRFEGVGARIPAGAWPAGDMRQPSMAVFEFQESPEMAPGTMINGEMVHFGPDGIMFNSPVDVSVPLGVTRPAFVYTVQKYDQNITPPWILKMGSKQAIQGGLGGSTLITGETDGFSPYGALEAPAPTSPPEETTPEPEDDGGCNGGCVAGSVIGSLAGAALIGGGGYYAWLRRDDWMPSGKEDGDGDEPPIVRQDARRDDGNTQYSQRTGEDQDDVNDREEV